MFDLPVGGIYGPYMRGGFYAVSKVMGRKAGAKAKASHILISYEGTAVPNKKEKRTKEEAKAKAKELGWKVVEDAGRGWRRVVPSPSPIRIEVKIFKLTSWSEVSTPAELSMASV